MRSSEKVATYIALYKAYRHLLGAGKASPEDAEGVSAAWADLNSVEKEAAALEIGQVNFPAEIYKGVQAVRYRE